MMILGKAPLPNDEFVFGGWGFVKILPYENARAGLDGRIVVRNPQIGWTNIFYQSYNFFNYGIKKNVLGRA